MKKAVIKFALIYLLFTVVFIAMKPLFMAVYSSLIGPAAADWFKVPLHGLAMDLSVAGYFSVVPGLLMAAALATGCKWPRRALNIYMAVAAGIVATLYCLDMGLYGSWGFRLDMTPFFYISTSPSAAMASVEWWQWPAAIAAIIAIAGTIWLCYRLIDRRLPIAAGTGRSRFTRPLIMLLLTALLFIPIRGSLTVSTMNISHSYFSTNQRLNHAAVNPLFSLLYSASHMTDFDSRYNFMDNDEAARITAATLHGTAPADSADTYRARPLLRTRQPDIVMVILESFSSHLLPSLGGDSIALGLDSIARNGVLFTDFYASSFRTDRGLAAILSGFLAPTSTSLLKYVDKFEKLPSLPGQLCKVGYEAEYYYGGDANFTNMQAYLMSAGFGHIVSDKDFPLAEKASKWGAPDDILFNRALRDIAVSKQDTADIAPRFRVIQTSSSHEPFEVNYANPRFAGQPRRNAFAYTDSCLTAFVDSLATLPGWDNTLLIILPDHYGCWPQNLENPLDRHRIPLVFAGGALLNAPMTVDTPASQTDIAATVSAMLDLPADSFRYSRDIFSAATPPLALFTEPGLAAIVTPSDTLVYDPDADAVLSAPPVDSLHLQSVRAILRDLYHYLDRL